LLSVDCDGVAEVENDVLGVAEETVGVVGGEDMASREKGCSETPEFSDKC
jgi:hypothetical protein